jgi:ferredoxin
VQCGLCLPACPTYRLEQLETESPRGRIALARGWALDLANPTASGDAHLDHCLGCRSCEVVCPAAREGDAAAGGLGFQLLQPVGGAGRQAQAALHALVGEGHQSARIQSARTRGGRYGAGGLRHRRRC